MTLVAGMSLGGTPGAPLPPTSAPATGAATVPAATIKIETAIRTHYENGDPMGDFFTALAVRFGVVIIQPPALDVYILRSFDMPAKVGDALTIARETLEPQGYSIVQKISDGRVIAHIVSVKEAKKILLSESPLSFGTQGEAVDVSDPTRLVTHLFPIAHAEVAESLRRSAKLDPDVSAEITGGGEIGANLILTGPALNVQRAVETLAKLDKPTEATMVARTVTLQHLDAQSAADALNGAFAQDATPMKAVADRRTNSIVVTGPEDRVVEVMVALVSQDAKQGRVLPPPGRTAPPIPIPPAAEPLPPPETPVPAPAERPEANRTTGAAGDLALAEGWLEARNRTSWEEGVAAAGSRTERANWAAGGFLTIAATRVRGIHCGQGARGLDEIAARGDNGGPTTGCSLSEARSGLWSFAKKGTIL